MEIISYLKGKKAQSEIKEMHETIGQDGFKHGTKDVADVFTNVDERINDLELKSKDRELSKKIEAVTENTAIQLNKNALRVGSFMNANKFRHTNLVFDDFKDISNVQAQKLNNVIHDVASHKISPIDATKSSSIIMKPESTSQVMKLVAETTHVSKNYMSLNFKFDDIETYYRVLKKNNALQLEQEKTVNDKPVYFHHGYIEFVSIYLEATLIFQGWYYNMGLTGESVQLYVASSKDGVIFDSYTLVKVGQEIKGCVKFKVVLSSSEGVINKEFISYDGITENPYTEVISSDLTLIKTHDSTGEKDLSWADKGVLFRQSFNRNDWSQLNSITIKP